MPKAPRITPKNIRDVAKFVSEFLKMKGIPHAATGNINVAGYSSPKMEYEIDFLVPGRALNDIQELGSTQSVSNLSGLKGATVSVYNVPVNFLFIPKYMPESTLTEGGEIYEVPVLSPEALILLKMHMPNPKSQSDVIEMIRSGRVNLDKLFEFVGDHDESMYDHLQVALELSRQK